MHGVEHVDRLQALPDGEVRRRPEPAHNVAVALVLDSQMRRQMGRHAADLAPAHRVRLPRHAEGAGAGLADAPRREMHIQDRKHFVGAG